MFKPPLGWARTEGVSYSVCQGSVGLFWHLLLCFSLCCHFRKQNERMKRGGRCGGETGSSTRTPVTQSRLFSVTFFSSFLWRQTGKSGCLRFLLPSCVRLLSRCCHSNRAPSSYWAYSVGSRVCGCVCVCVLLVPLCICVSVRRLTSVRKCGNSERFHSLFLVDLKVWNVEGVSAGLAVKSLESGTVMLLAVSLWKLVQLSVRLTGPPANGSPGALLQSGGGLRRHQQPGEVVSGLWCR